ncbi:FAD-binding and (Fe-S)-binding domain-containing protein [Candidatus Binatus sp.]|jgi:FAD/FMN-containing dehydrogenase/Fe-S oxidoreductase|uniref:FAD-binding and (Fe-S)-binding domain-containing protein n=4 Tax=Candidatus Binatus sp. TaxID=2811406 RepID=UPI003C4D9AA8
MVSLDSVKLELARQVEGEVRFDAGTRAAYATDASNYRQVPVGVVIPRHEGDVIAALSIARENSMPILARGAATSLAGQACNAALVLDFSKYMNRVIAIEPGARVARVEPGVIQSHLNAALAPHGLFFAPDPSTKDRCTVGGMIGNNSCGAHSAAYGKTVDNVEALEVILYDGTQLSLTGSIADAEIGAAIARGGREGELYSRIRELRDQSADSVRAHFPRLPRRVSGYNLDELMPERGFNLARAIVGSEGTLAAVIRATIRAVPRPNELGLVVLGFDDVFIAADQTPWLLEHRPEALEGFDENLPEFARIKAMPGVRFLPAGRAFLLVELGGESQDEARERAERVIAQARGLRECTGATYLADAREQAAVWQIRESGLGSSAFIPGRPRSWPGAEDSAVPPAKLGAFLRGFDRILTSHGLRVATYYGHFGEGCVHARINFDLASAPGIATFRATMIGLGELVANLGGSLSGEHGDGLARSELLPTMFRPELIDAFRDFKRIFDPDSMMNPGVIVDPHPLDSHLKLGANYRPREIATHFNFRAEGGLAGAALRCVGIGKCRKTEAGTMCPSYMATREEIHSTRGRARILFEALTTDLLPDGFADPAVRDALDLCLSCKGCRSECPSSVDMAAYRAEFFFNYYRSHRRPLSSAFFGRLNEVARLASYAPSLANALAHAPIVGGVAKKALAIHPRRELPRFARRTFRSWFERRAAPRAGGREVVLFPDTFNNFFEPHVAIAAVEVLERAGFRVIIPRHQLCCGRPLYDQGMLEQAKTRLKDVMEALDPFVAVGIPIVGLEPSCILTFRDELPSLFPDDPRAIALASNSLLLDELIVREGDNFAPPELRRRTIVQGHCHQKAIAGIGGEVMLLSRAAGAELEVLDAGCCGMAGAFGYDRGHFEVSKAIGERVLIPAIEKAPPEAIIVADGFSCRSQIRHFCPSRRPMHLAEVLNLADGG